MKILIAVDGSTSSDAVIQEAAARPWPKGSEFYLLTVVDPFFFTRAPLLLQEAKKSTSEALEESAKPLKNAGWEVTSNVVLDSPRHAIARLASEWKVDLILIGSRGRGSFGRLLLGSTAQAVLRHAASSVEIVRSGHRDERADGAGGMRILIPTDGSQYARLALHSVAERPWPDGSEFKVISCPEFPVLVGEFPYYSPEQVTGLAKNSDVHAEESAASGAALLQKADLPTTREVTEARDTPVRAILSAAEAWKANLIVMGSHGRRGFNLIVMGSVSESVALHAHCSVEVTRRSPNQDGT
jgi:nucleotide-binding universal stress UspA family protein